MTTDADAGAVRPWRLDTRTRKGFLAIHIASAGAWIGIDIVMAVLVATAATADDDRTRVISYQALEKFAAGSLVAAGVACLLSGIVLGLGTKYGLVRYWWVALKLVANVILTVLVIAALRPGIAAKAEDAGRFMTGESVSLAVGDLVFPPIVSLTVLSAAVVLSVYKPWGRIRPQRDGARRMHAVPVDTGGTG